MGITYQVCGFCLPAVKEPLKGVLGLYPISDWLEGGIRGGGTIRRSVPGGDEECHHGLFKVII